MQEQEVAKIEVGDGAAIPTPDDRGLVSAWWIALIGAVALLVLLPVIKPDPYLNILRFVPDGILITFQVTVLSISLAIVIGLFTGLGRISSNRLINLVASLYVEVVRGIPLLVQLFYIYYALGRFVRVPDLVAAVIAMAFCYGAYMGEVFRAGIKSIDRGQTEAARSLGLSARQTMMRIILPQAFKNVLPAMCNEFVAVTKETSLASTFYVGDLMTQYQTISGKTYLVIEPLVIIGVIYFVVTFSMSKLITVLERRLKNDD